MAGLFRSGLLRVVPAIALSGMVVAVASAPPAVGAVPSLRLMAAQRGITLDPTDPAGALDLGLWVAAVGGDFQLDVR